MPLPQLSDEQRKAALEKAAAARHARAELRDKIKKGETTLEDVLDSDDPIASLHCDQRAGNLSCSGFLRIN